MEKRRIVARLVERGAAEQEFDRRVWREAGHKARFGALVHALRVWKALAAFGAPLTGLTPQDFTDRRKVYQMGVVPNRVDIVMEIDGVEFDEAWRPRGGSTFEWGPLRLIVLDE